MTYANKKTIKVHTFSPLPPLSIDDFKQLERFAGENNTEVAGAFVPEDGPYICLVAVLYGNWHLVEQEMKRMGRDFNESVPYWLNSATGEVGLA